MGPRYKKGEEAVCTICRPGLDKMLVEGLGRKFPNPFNGHTAYYFPEQDVMDEKEAIADCLFETTSSIVAVDVAEYLSARLDVKLDIAYGYSKYVRGMLDAVWSDMLDANPDLGMSRELWHWGISAMAKATARGIQNDEYYIGTCHLIAEGFINIIFDRVPGSGLVIKEAWKDRSVDAMASYDEFVDAVSDMYINRKRAVHEPLYPELRKYNAHIDVFRALYEYCDTFHFSRIERMISERSWGKFTVTEKLIRESRPVYEYRSTKTNEDLDGIFKHRFKTFMYNLKEAVDGDYDTLFETIMEE